MAKLSVAKKRDIENAPTEAEKIKKAAAVMIETPLDLIRQIMQRHEESVIEVMRELDVERRELRDALELLVAGIENSVSDTFIPLVRAKAALSKVGDGDTAHNDKVQAAPCLQGVAPATPGSAD